MAEVRQRGYHGIISARQYARNYSIHVGVCVCVLDFKGPTCDCEGNLHRVGRERRQNKACSFCLH